MRSRGKNKIFILLIPQKHITLPTLETKNLMDIDILLNEAVTLLCQLIETPRTSRNENAAADILERFILEHALTYQRVGANIIVGKCDYDANMPTLLLNAHIDTVKPTSSWSHDPYKATIDGDTLLGLGANDDGASLVSLLQVYRMLETTKQNFNLIFVVSAEEEISGKNGFESILPLLPHIDVALVGEPTGMQPAIAEKGLMVLDVVARGKTGHAARNEGDNAIYHAIDDIQWFRTYQFPKESEILGKVKMTVTIVNSGSQHNVVPAECTFTVDIRSNDCYSNEEIFNIVKQNVKSEVTARSFRLNSSKISEAHTLVQRAIAMGGTPFGSSTLSDQALMPFPSMKMGPGESCRSHSADEFVLISEIREAILIYYNLLNGLPIAQG